jgi:hypothetical protein
MAPDLRDGKTNPKMMVMRSVTGALKPWFKIAEVTRVKNVKMTCKNATVSY